MLFYLFTGFCLASAGVPEIDDPHMRTLEKNAEGEFVSYDVDGNGEIDVADLRAKFKGSLKDPMLFKFMNDADKLKKGFLTLEEYINYRKELLSKHKKPQKNE